MLIETKKCTRCLGEGKIKGFDYYSNPMPKEKEYTCSMCKGKGIILIIPYGYGYSVESGYNDYPKI